MRLTGNVVSWIHDGVKRNVKLGEVSLTVTAASGGVTSGDVTTAPEGGLACHVAEAGLSGHASGSTRRTRA